MAVYTNLNKKDIINITNKFNLGKLKKYSGIKDGIENTNYFIQTKKYKVILTIFEKRVRSKDIPYFVNFMLALHKKKVKCSNRKEVLNYFAIFKKNYPNNLPKCLIHGDIFPDNIFYHKNKFNGFIDFYFSFHGPYVYEIAIAINSMCFTKNVFDEAKANNLLKGYQSIRKLSNLELKSLPILCLGAAIRFYVTRLYDYKFTPKNAKVKRKDPKEYLDKMRFFSINLLK